MSLAVRHTNGYPYRNLYLEVSYPDRDSNSTLMRDTVNVELADIYGNWHGSGLGTSFQFSMTLNDNFLLSDRSSEIRVRHIMRPDPVTDIEQVGIVLSPLSEKIMNKRLLLLSADEVRRRLLRVGAVVPTLISDNANLFI